MLPNNYQESLICVEKACQLAGLSFRYLDQDKIMAEVVYPDLTNLFFIHNKNPFNNFTSARVCQDKSLQAQIYSKSNIQHPKTKMYFNPLASKSFNNYKQFQNIDTLKKDIIISFSYPFFLKKNISSLSKDVHLIRNEEDLENHISRYFTQNSTNILIIQSQIIGQEYRVISWRGFPLLAYEKGSKFSKYKPIARKLDPAQFQEIANKIYKTLNIDFCGIDIIKSNNKLYVLETNANPACFYYNKHNGREDFTQVYLRCLQEYQS